MNLPSCFRILLRRRASRFGFVSVLFLGRRRGAALPSRVGRCRHHFALLTLLSFTFAACATEVGPVAPRSPRLFPDYSGIVIPPNVAPLNFIVQEPGRRYRVQVHSRQGIPLEITGRKPAILLPLRPWKALLQASAGQELYFEVSTEDEAGQWTRFNTVTNRVAREEVDGYLVYRLLKPLYNIYANMGIYQRRLADYEETEVLANRSLGRDCLNCHTFLNHEPDRFVIQIRGREHGKPMLLVQTNQIWNVSQTAGYASWHPSGQLLAFSVNKFSQFFHTVGETRDVFDADSGLKLYDVESRRVITPPAISLPDRLETWPAWSPDGQWLYFCSAPKLEKGRFREVRYDLMRIRHDFSRGTWGSPETLVSAQETGLSAGQPRLSPDGRFLLYCLYEYGNFPVFQPSSDLHLMDLASGQSRRLDINSPESDSWHCWSSNSRWVVFSSKRLDGLFARPHFSHVDEHGRFSKPFVLPQRDPAFYGSFLKTFNVPELIRHPIRVSARELTRAVVAPREVLKPALDPSQPAPAARTGAEDEEDTRYQQVPR